MLGACSELGATLSSVNSGFAEWCVTLDKSYHLSVDHFPHPWNEDTKNVVAITFIIPLGDFIHIYKLWFRSPSWAPDYATEIFIQVFHSVFSSLSHTLTCHLCTSSYLLKLQILLQALAWLQPMGRR